MVGSSGNLQLSVVPLVHERVAVSTVLTEPSTLYRQYVMVFVLLGVLAHWKKSGVPCQCIEVICTVATQHLNVALVMINCQCLMAWNSARVLAPQAS